MTTAVEIKRGDTISLTPVVGTDFSSGPITATRVYDIIRDQSHTLITYYVGGLKRQATVPNFRQVTIIQRGSRTTND